MANRIRLCELGREDAIKIIKNTGLNKVYYRSGVWNSYELVDMEYAIQGITNSGYGADIYEEDGKYYVSCPCDSDMW